MSFGYAQAIGALYSDACANASTLETFSRSEVLYLGSSKVSIVAGSPVSLSLSAPLLTHAFSAEGMAALDHLLPLQTDTYGPPGRTMTSGTGPSPACMTLLELG